MERNDAIPDGLLSRLSEFIADRMGLYFPQTRWADLRRGICRAAADFGFEDTEPCIHWLMSAPLTTRQMEILAGHLTVGETYFFREKQSFEAVQSHILPELRRARQGGERRLRIWSAGCCTGEEPYSIAILLDKIMPDLRDWRVTILGTDINPRSLRKASEGVYSKWSFRDTPEWARAEYFKTIPSGRLEVIPRIRDRVTFSYLNLAEDAYPLLDNNTNAMDVIFCRNVLMYFSPDRARRVIQGFYRALVDGGWLVVSPTEASHTLFTEFAPVYFPGAIFYRRDPLRKRPAGVAGFAPQPPAAPRPAFQPVSAPPVRTVPGLETTPVRLAGREPSPTEPYKPQRTPFEEAVALYEQGRYAEAEEGLLGLFSADHAGGNGGNGGTTDGKAMALLARTYADRGRLDEALSWCEKALAAEKLNPGHHHLRAIILQEQGQADGAAGALRRALYLDPGFALAHFALGNLMLRQGWFRDSVRHFRNALETLAAYRAEDTVPESGGLTAGRLSEMITSMVREVSP